MYIICAKHGFIYVHFCILIDLPKLVVIVSALFLYTFSLFVMIKGISSACICWWYMFLHYWSSSPCVSTFMYRYYIYPSLRASLLQLALLNFNKNSKIVTLFLFLVHSTQDKIIDLHVVGNYCFKLICYIKMSSNFLKWHFCLAFLSDHKLIRSTQQSVELDLAVQ